MGYIYYCHGDINSKAEAMDLCNNIELLAK